MKKVELVEALSFRDERRREVSAYLRGKNVSVNRSFYMPNRIEISGGIGNDEIANLTVLQTVIIHGGTGDDVLRGLNDALGLYGDEGKDTLEGSMDFDTIAGNDAVLYVEGSEGNDLIELYRNDGRLHLRGHGRDLNRSLRMPNRILRTPAIR